MTVADTAAPVPGPRREGRHFRRLLSGELVNKTARFAAAAVLARALTHHQFGVFNIALAVGGVIVMLCSLGFAEVSVRRLAIERDTGGLIAGSVVSTRLALAALILVPAGIGVVLVDPGALGLVLATGAMVVAMLMTGEWFARGLERMAAVAAGTALGGLAALGGAVVVAGTGLGATAALAAFAVGEAVATVTYWALTWRGFHLSLRRRHVRDMLRESWPVAVSSVAVYAYYANADTVIVGAYHGASAAGIYSAAYRVYLTANVVAVFAAYSVFASSSRHTQLHGEVELVRALQGTLRLLAGYGALVLAAILVAGRPVLRLLFGSGFDSAGTALILLGVSSAWYGVGYVVGYNLIAIERARRFGVGAAVAGLGAIGLDFVLVPHFAADGAAAATTLAIILATAVWMQRALPDPSVRPVLVLLLLVTIAGALAVAAPATRWIGAAACAACALAVAGPQLWRRA